VKKYGVSETGTTMVKPNSCKGSNPSWKRAKMANVNLGLLQPLQWSCVDCVIHHERVVGEEQQYICVARASNNERDCDA